MLDFQLNLRKYQTSKRNKNKNNTSSSYRPVTAITSKNYLNPINKIENKKYFFKFALTKTEQLHKIRFLRTKNDLTKILFLIINK